MPEIGRRLVSRRDGWGLAQRVLVRPIGVHAGVAVALLLLSTACGSSTAPAAGQQAPPGPGDLIRQFYASLNGHRVEAVRGFYAADYIEHERSLPNQAAGFQGDRQLFTSLFAAVPDVRFTVRDVLAEGMKVAARITYSGTAGGHGGSQAPTGQPVNATMIELYLIEGGKFAEHWGAVTGAPVLGTGPGATSPAAAVERPPGALRARPAAVEARLRPLRARSAALESPGGTGESPSAETGSDSPSMPISPETTASEAPAGAAAVIQRLTETIDAHDVGPAASLFAPDYVDHAQSGNGGSNFQAYQESFRALFQGFPNLHVLVEDTVSQGAEIAVRASAHGTNLGPYEGRPPTNRSASFEAFEIYRLRDGRIAERWAVTTGPTFTSSTPSPSPTT